LLLVEDKPSNYIMIAAKNIYSSGKIANIERLRVLGAIGIVWFHTKHVPLRSMGYAGLPIFLLIFISLIVRYSHFHNFEGFAKRRAHRLLLPWIFWSGIYGICILGREVLHGGSFFEGFATNNFLIGTSIHLWYLPYSFAIALCLYGINKFSSKISDFTVILIMLFLSVATLYVSSMVTTYSMSAPLPQWFFGLASLPLGIAIGRCCYLTNKKTEIILMTIIVLVTVIVCLLLARVGYTDLPLPYGIGTTLVCIAYLWHGQYGRLTEFMAPLTYGIYLIHPIVGHFVRFVTVFRQFAWLDVIVTFAISAMLIFAMKRSLLKRFI